MREISQRSYDRQTRDMDDIYSLSPLMRETLTWFARGGCIGCPGTLSTLEALKKRGLVDRTHSGGWKINETGRKAVTS